MYLHASRISRYETYYRFLKEHPHLHALFLFSEGDVLQTIQLLLPKHTSLGAVTGDVGRHTSLLTSLSTQTWTQTAPRCVSTQTCAENNQIPAALKGKFETKINLSS